MNVDAASSSITSDQTRKVKWRGNPLGSYSETDKALCADRDVGLERSQKRAD